MSFAIVMSMLAISLEENFGFSPKEVGYTMTGAAIVHAQSRENGTNERLRYTNYIHGCVYNQCQLCFLNHHTTTLPSVVSVLSFMRRTQLGGREMH